MELKYGNITISVSSDDPDECREAYLAFGELCGFYQYILNMVVERVKKEIDPVARIREIVSQPGGDTLDSQQLLDILESRERRTNYGGP